MSSQARSQKNFSFLLLYSRGVPPRERLPAFIRAVLRSLRRLSSVPYGVKPQGR